MGLGAPAREGVRPRTKTASWFTASGIGVIILSAALAAGQGRGSSPTQSLGESEPGGWLPPSGGPDAKAVLGRELFFDQTLSVPAGQSCASCHAPEAGFTHPDSSINARFGVAPGAIRTRFGSRAVPQVSYAAFIQPGPPFYNPVIGLYAGGQFWDGHAADLEDQAKFPFVNPNEMNNLTHDLPDPSLVVRQVATGRSAARFRAVFGADVFSRPTSEVFGLVAEAIAAYERSGEVSPFSSKYDAWRAGLARFTPSETLGLRLVTGTWTGRPDGAAYPRFAHCVECHAIPSTPSGSPDLWTDTGYQNIGVPRNPNNPFYLQTDRASNPVGYNPLGTAFVDYGLGATFYTRMGLPPGNIGPGSDGEGDFLGVNGTFKAPSLRNVDRRPHRGFVKAYMHNGVFKSLEQVVHFYNTRNLTTARGEVIDFTRDDPYAGLRGRPLWATPEYPSFETLVNPSGILGTLPGTGAGGESDGQVGNLGLTAREEEAIVAFLRTLSDGYFRPNFDAACVAVISQPVSQRVSLGGSAKFTVAPSVRDDVAYQWRVDGVPIEGETLSFYTIVAATLADAGRYDCVISVPCGGVTSRGAELEVCAADFNGDGAVSRDDLVEFMEAFRDAQSSADLNADGMVDGQDLRVFFEAYFAGC